MNIDQKSLLDSVTGWIASFGQGLRNAFARPVGDDKAAESDQSTDPDFDGWLVNDPMVTLNPASRYGDDATGFLGGSACENPDPLWKDD